MHLHPSNLNTITVNLNTIPFNSNTFKRGQKTLCPPRHTSGSLQGLTYMPFGLVQSTTHWLNTKTSYPQIWLNHKKETKKIEQIKKLYYGSNLHYKCKTYVMRIQQSSPCIFIFQRLFSYNILPLVFLNSTVIL